MAEIIADGILAGVPRELAISRAVDAYAKFHDLENLMGRDLSRHCCASLNTAAAGSNHYKLMPMNASLRFSTRSPMDQSKENPPEGHARLPAKQELLAADFSQVPDQRTYGGDKTPRKSSQARNIFPAAF